MLKVKYSFPKRDHTCAKHVHQKVHVHRRGMIPTFYGYNSGSFYWNAADLIFCAVCRSQYRKDAQTAYQVRMLAAHSGRGNYPKIRTFNQWDTSTNSVFNDLKEAETWTGLEQRVDISDLTWEQRERVLRLMFAKLNGHKSKRR